LIFGGKSFEHDVSIESAKNVFRHLNKIPDNTEFNVIPVYVDKKGYFHGERTSDALLSGNTKVPEEFFYSKKTNFEPILQKVDIFFPMIHGRNGEDGNLQGFLELSNKKYIGSKTLASAICMDKATSKDIMKCNGIVQANYFYFYLSKDEIKDCEFCENVIIQNGLTFPVFIKPSMTGSSIGISKVSNISELKNALKSAARYDNKILVEQGVKGREIECAVAEIEGDIFSSIPGEIGYKSDFYDYQAKYESAETILSIPAKIPDFTIEEIRKTSENLFKLFGLKDFARIDFFLDGKKIVVNEINTIPGFTNSSMFPLLMEHSGYPVHKLLRDIILSYL